MLVSRCEAVAETSLVDHAEHLESRLKSAQEPDFADEYVIRDTGTSLRNKTPC